VKFDDLQAMSALADDLELAAKLLRSTGVQALRTTEGWMLGPRSPNLNPSAGGQRHDGPADPDDTRPLTSDPTGEMVLKVDKVGMLHGELLAGLTFLHDAAPQVIRVVRLACPDHAAFTLAANEMTATQISAAGWCTSCWRVNGHHTPITTRRNGTRRYRDSCNWCGEWADAHDGRQPPLRLLELHLQGKRITKRLVDEITAAEENERREARRQNRAKSKKKRKGRK
jgi:hypothetical protein